MVEPPDLDRIVELSGVSDGAEAVVSVSGLHAGYGKMAVLHDFNLQIGAGRALCLVGPNGAGKSTVLHSIYGFTDIYDGTIRVDGQDVTRLTPNEKLRAAGVAYILQDNSVFADMTVEENLLMGGFLLPRAEARDQAERVMEAYPKLSERRRQPARVLSGGERRMLEITRALVMNPQVLLVDEPSIGLEPRFIEEVFGVLRDLRDRQGKTIVIVEQNARKGLEFADVGYVLVAGRVARAGTGKELLDDPEVGRLFLGG